MSTLEHALVLAAAAHSGQTDKAGAPYLLHPVRVMLRVRSPEARMAALLHDVVEDTAWSLDGLRAQGFSETVVTTVDALTRRPDESYNAFIDRAAAEPLAVEVKLADLADNADLGRFATPGPDDVRRARKYERAMDRLRRKAAAIVAAP